MAYNEITLPKWQDLVRRRFGLQGPGGNVPVLAPEIQPVVVVEPSAFEHELLRKNVHYLRSEYRTIGAAQYASMALRNPPDSGKFLIVERIYGFLHWLSAPPAWPIPITPTLIWNDEIANPVVSTFDAGPSATGPRDLRRMYQLSVGESWHDTRPAPYPAVSGVYGGIPAWPSLWPVPAADNLEVTFDLEDCSFLLIPGSALIVQVGLNTVSNSEIGCGWKWYEFDAEQAELTA